MRQVRTVRGELALLAAVLINSASVVLMLRSGSGISAISSVPYGFSVAFPFLSLGTWNYLFQTLLVLVLMLLRRRFVPEYLLSFAVGFCFGCLMDLHERWAALLPQTPALCAVYFVVSYAALCFGVALSNRCRLPIAPTDLFSREVADIFHIPYPRVKIPFDVLCLCTTAAITHFLAGGISGLGIGTVVAALTMGKTIGIITKWIDKRAVFVSFLHH